MGRKELKEHRKETTGLEQAQGTVAMYEQQLEASRKDSNRDSSDALAAHINSRNCSGVRPASRAMSAIVKALMGL